MTTDNQDGAPVLVPRAYLDTLATFLEGLQDYLTDAKAPGRGADLCGDANWLEFHLATLLGRSTAGTHPPPESKAPEGEGIQMETCPRCGVTAPVNQPCPSGCGAEPHICGGCQRPCKLCWLMPCLYLERIKEQGKPAVKAWLESAGYVVTVTERGDLLCDL